MSNKQKALLFDMVECIGCRNCVKACMEKQGFEGDPEQTTELSATAYTAMFMEPVGEDGDEYPLRKMCRHCLTPSCVSVCPVAALQKTDLGPVIYDASRCIGCRYCMLACPFNVPRYEWHDPIPAVRKCDMCYDRQKDGKPTACAEACPADATIVGTREEILAEAHRRIEDDPETYYPHVYGETEIGGTSVLFLAPAELAATPEVVASMGFRTDLGDEPLPALTWKVLSKIPAVVIAGGASLMAIWWITRRRNEVALVEGSPARPIRPLFRDKGEKDEEGGNGQQ